MWLKIYGWFGRSPSAAWASFKSCRCRTRRWIAWPSSPFPDCIIWLISTWPTIRSAASKNTPSPEPLPSAYWCSPTTRRSASIPPLFQVLFHLFTILINQLWRISHCLLPMILGITLLGYFWDSLWTLSLSGNCYAPFGDDLCHWSGGFFVSIGSNSCIVFQRILERVHSENSRGFLKACAGFSKLPGFSDTEFNRGIPTIFSGIIEYVSFSSILTRVNLAGSSSSFFGIPQECFPCIFGFLGIFLNMHREIFLVLGIFKDFQVTRISGNS